MIVIRRTGIIPPAKWTFVCNNHLIMILQSYTSTQAMNTISIFKEKIKVATTWIRCVPMVNRVVFPKVRNAHLFDEHYFVILYLLLMMTLTMYRATPMMMIVSE